MEAPEVEQPGTVVAVAGEALVDLVPAGPDGLFRAAPGGSPANVAVGLARLEVPVRMLARISGDPLGQRLRAHLAGNGVDLSHAVAAAEPSSLAVVDLAEDGSAQYDFRVEGTADWQWREEELVSALEGVSALHVGSIALTAPPGAAVLRRLAARARATSTVTFDPNVRPRLMGSPSQVLAVVDEMLPVVDVIKASAEDVEWLLPGQSIEQVVQEWAARGPSLVVVTRGGDGAVAVGRTSGLVVQPGRPVQVADTVGAGDSFMSALISGLSARDLLGAARREALAALDSASVLDVLAEAVAAASITCGRLGADPPSARELRAALTG